jgi:uncharacterized membrane protein YkoI
MKTAIYAGLLFVLLGSDLAPAQAPAQPAPSGQAPAPQTAPAQPNAAKITQDQAVKIALERVAGKSTSVEIERKLGKMVYTVEVRTPEGGEVDVFVDMETGEIIGTD